SLKLLRCVTFLQHQCGLPLVACLSFKKCWLPNFPSNVKNWRQKFFYLRPRDGSFTYFSNWSIIVIESFNKSVIIDSSLSADLNNFKKVDARGIKFSNMITLDVLSSFGLDGKWLR